MSYPPSQYPQSGGPQPYGGYPAQQGGYPPPPPAGYPPPPHNGYPAPPATSYPAPPSGQAPRQRRRPRWLYWTALTICLGIAAVAVVSTIMETEPKTGDCLTSMDDRFFGGLEVVSCSSPDAKYEVVAHTDNSRYPCDDYPEGESFVNSGKRGKVYWSICAVKK